jgi:hypothetical protein
MSFFSDTLYQNLYRPLDCFQHRELTARRAIDLDYLPYIALCSLRSATSSTPSWFPQWAQQ